MTRTREDQKQIPVSPLDPTRARVESIGPDGDRALRVRGFALIAKPSVRPADAVLLTWRTEGGEPMILAVVEVGAGPAPAQYHFDLEYTGRQSLEPARFYRWQKRFERSLLPGIAPGGGRGVGFRHHPPAGLRHRGIVGAVGAGRRRGGHPGPPALRRRRPGGACASGWTRPQRSRVRRRATGPGSGAACGEVMGGSLPSAVPSPTFCGQNFIFIRP